MRKPLVIFDGECGFCRRWIAYWQVLTGDRVDYASSQEVGAQFPQIPPQAFQRSVQFVRPDGTVLSGAHAVFAALGANPRLRWLHRIYQRVPLVARVTEAAYSFVAEHRVLFSRITYALWGDKPEPARYQKTRGLYLKALGAVYLAAFASFASQASGLIGPRGILPSGYSEGVLHALSAGGIAASLALLLGGASLGGLTVTVGAIAAWVLYGYVLRAGQEFLGFQWDALLMEMGFFSIFLTFGRAPARLAIWILRWLLFRVVFCSGYVKLASGDPHWRDLTALRFHFETQPLPTWLGWAFHQLPDRALQACAAGMFAFELAVPLLYFLPRRPRIFAFFATVFLQFLIDATGNYGFFGWQTCALALLLLDDQWLEDHARKIIHLMRVPKDSGPGLPARRHAETALLVAAALLVVGTTVLPIERVVAWAQPLQSIHSYGVFAVMTTERREIVFEGSRDGQNWLPYELPWKPGALNRRPAFCEPHMPRLDWQLWFAALGEPGQNPWVENVAGRLLEGSPAVLGLFAQNPFPDAPPEYVRATFYQYHFTDIDTLRRTGQWWTREAQGEYMPAAQLRHL